jgi:hypothetical protein
VTQAAVIPMVLLVGFLTKKENDNRDEFYREIEGEVYDKENFEFLDLTDIENKKFRYLY